VERLWSPWRLSYVAGGGGGDKGCIFCGAVAGTYGADLVLLHGRTCFVLLNLYPYNNGHLMVVPNRHIATLASASSDELAEMMQLVRHAERALGEAYTPHGVNVGMNLGRPAGAGIVDHLHMHVVPRWNGDTNFMTVFGDTRVLPEALDQTAARLRPIFERLVRDETQPRSHEGTKESTKKS
jgi:ATP adenylyltransferase